MREFKQILVAKRKRERLSYRLHWIFFRDALEGTLDSAVRRIKR